MAMLLRTRSYQEDLTVDVNFWPTLKHARFFVPIRFHDDTSAFTVNARSHCFLSLLHRSAFVNVNQPTSIARAPPLFSFLKLSCFLCNHRVRSLFKPIDIFSSLYFYIRRKLRVSDRSISFLEEIRESVFYAKSNRDRVDVFTILSLVHLQVSLQQVYTATVGDK